MQYEGYRELHVGTTGKIIYSVEEESWKKMTGIRECNEINIQARIQVSQFYTGLWILKGGLAYIRSQLYNQQKYWSY